MGDLHNHVVEFVTKNPGLTSTKIAEGIVAPVGSIRSALRVLRVAGRVRMDGAKKGARYFVVPGTAPGTEW